MTLVLIIGLTIQGTVGLVTIVLLDYLSIKLWDHLSMVLWTCVPIIVGLNVHRAVKLVAHYVQIPLEYSDNHVPIYMLKFTS